METELPLMTTDDIGVELGETEFGLAGEVQGQACQQALGAHREVVVRHALAERSMRSSDRVGATLRR
jgi:hypothetical protein